MRTTKGTYGRHRWKRSVVPAVACLALLATACDRGGPDRQASPGTATTSTTAGDGAVRAPTIRDLLGVGGSRTDIARGVRENDRIRQELIRDCMAEQGFDYVVHVTAGKIEHPHGLPTDLSDEEFRRKYGYGIATGFESAITRPPSEAQRDADEDPNAAIVAGMSPSARAAYERALHGDAAPNEPPEGCEGQAIEATDRTTMLMEEFGDQLTDLWARVEADPRLVDAEKDWATCMRKAGYSYADEEAIRRELLRRLNPLNAAVVGQDVPEGVIDVVPGKTLTAEQRKLLAELRDFELAVANADQDCRGNLDKVREQVRTEYESRFVNENRTRLRELFPDGDL